MLNMIRRWLGLHVHEWGEIECAFLGPRHTHAKWCKTCGDYKMIVGLVCYTRRPPSNDDCISTVT